MYTNVQVFRRKKSNAITLSALYLRWQNVYWENTTVGWCKLIPMHASTDVVGVYDFLPVCDAS